MNEITFIYIPVPDKEVAATIGRKLLEEKLAGCVNIFPGMESLYWWEGKIEMDHESVLIVKTSKNLLVEVEKQVLELHPYSTPCIAVLHIDKMNPGYAAWLTESLK